MSHSGSTRRIPREEMSLELAAVATGRKPASLVIRNGKWVNVHTAEIIPATDIAVAGSRIAYVGQDASHAIGQDTKVIDAAGRYLVPGLCDAHMHVESGMVTVTEFCRAVIPHGTTSMFIDPHEIANVLGLPGIRLMHDEALTMPIGVYLQMPSCVPSAPGMEDAGATITPADVAEAMTWPGIIGLGEMMSFTALAHGDADAHAIVANTIAAGKTVGGHCPISHDTLDFHAYAASGPADDHEITDMAGAIARARRGMRSMLRLGSAWHDVAATVRAITEGGLDARHFVLCTDDSHSGTLVNEGHMDRVVRHAISRGLRPVTAIQMATLNVAEHFGVAGDIGSIAPGRIADMIITSDLVELPIEEVYAGGRQVAGAGKLSIDLPPYPYPASACATVKIGRELAAADFTIAASNGTNPIQVNVIGVIENQAPTRALQAAVPVRAGNLVADASQDIAQIAVVSRHDNKGNVAQGFVHGLGLYGDCAIASTVMHDSHNLIVAGTTPTQMALASNRLAMVGGGVTVWRDGRELAIVELPIAGLMSDERADLVAAKATAMVAAMATCGCKLNNAYMQLSLLGLAVIPELRITNRGLLDVRNFSSLPLEVAG